MAKMGAYGHISPGELSSAISDILREYGDVVYVATEEGLDAAEKVMVNALKSASPKRRGKFAKAWRGSGKKYKLSRFAFNPTTVSGRKGAIPLSNILEYSPVRGHPFIKETVEKNIDAMAQAVVSTIKKEV